MRARTYVLYGQSTTGGSAIAYVEAVDDATIYSIRHASVYAGAAATSGFIYVELSFSSTSQFGVNDALGVLDALAFYHRFGTAVGELVTEMNPQRAGLRVPWKRGERIYLHMMYASAAPTAWSDRILIDTIT